MISMVIEQHVRVKNLQVLGVGQPKVGQVAHAQSGHRAVVSRFVSQTTTQDAR